MVDPPYRTKNFVVGTIILWFGSIANIPSGYHLCNGEMGTPDLQNQFVVGAGDTYDVGDSGADWWHWHYFVAGTDISAGANFRSPTGGAAHLPPYHGLCWIMKVN